MNCKYYRKLLYLNRPGELTERQQNKLNRHLSTCSRCAAERIKIEKMNDFIALAGQTKPVQPEPGLITAGIMRAVRNMNAAPRKNLLDFFSFPRTRLALIGMSAVLVGMFLMQEFLVLYRISKLEDKMARRTSEQTELIENRAQRYDRFITGQALHQGELFIAAWKADKTPDHDRVVVKKSTLLAWLKAYRELQQENKFLRKYLQEKLPGLEGISFEDGLDFEEINKIIKNKEHLFEYL